MSSGRAFMSRQRRTLGASLHWVCSLTESEAAAGSALRLQKRRPRRLCPASPGDRPRRLQPLPPALSRWLKGWGPCSHSQRLPPSRPPVSEQTASPGACVSCRHAFPLLALATFVRECERVRGKFYQTHLKVKLVASRLRIAADGWDDAVVMATARCLGSRAFSSEGGRSRPQVSPDSGAPHSADVGVVPASLPSVGAGDPLQPS